MARARYITINDGTKTFPVLQPDTLDAPRCNSIHVPRGPYPGVARLLVTRAVRDRMATDGLYTIYWYDYDEGSTPNGGTFGGYYFTGATNTDPDGDSQAAVEIELQDYRWILWQMPRTKNRFNILRPIPIYVADAGTDADRNKYLVDSLFNGSTLNTWQQVWDKLWEPTGGSEWDGFKPDLPYTPVGTPKNMHRWADDAIPAWQSICEFLNLIGCDICYDPSATYPDYLSVVRLGTTQSTGFPNATPIVDWKPTRFDTRSAFGTTYENPRFIDVAFPVLSPLQQTRPYIVEDAISSGAGTRLVVWDTTPAVAFNAAGARSIISGEYTYPEPQTIANATELADRALEIATNAHARIATGEAPYHKWFGGIAGCKLGSQISSVICRDLGDEDGLLTEVKCGPSPMLLCPPSQIQPALSWIGKTTGTSHALDATQAVTYYMSSNGVTGADGTSAATTVTVDCYHRFGHKITGVQWVLVSWVNDRWEIVSSYRGNITPLTDNSNAPSAADNTLQSTINGTTYATDSTGLRNNITDLAAKVNELIN